MPADVETEKLILGSLLLDGEKFCDVAATLSGEDFAIEKHRRIFDRMASLYERGDKIDRVTVANELIRRDELQSVDGLGYLVSLDDNLPKISNLDAYIRIVRDKAALRKIAVATQHTMNRALIGEESPEDILAAAEETLLGIGDTRFADDGLVHGGEFLRKFPGGFSAFAEPHKRETGVRTGFVKLDEMTGGLRPGELIILAARPSMGKSALAFNIAWHVATAGNLPVAAFSLEMSTESLLLRMLCSAARVDSHRMRSGYLNEVERQKIRDVANRLLEAEIYIDDSTSVGLLDIHSKLRRLRKKLKVNRFGLVVIDYLQLMGGSSRERAENRNQEVSRLTRGLKLMSKEFDSPFLVLSQLSRASEQRTGDKRPQLSDLRESGSIEQDADLVSFVFRPEVYHRDREDLRGVAELILAKQRSGPVGKIDLVFLHSQVRFENKAEDLPPEEDNERLPYAEER